MDDMNDMKDAEIEFRETLRIIQNAAEEFAIAQTIVAMRHQVLRNFIFDLQAHPYQLGTICLYFTNQGVPYANNTFICLN